MAGLVAVTGGSVGVSAHAEALDGLARCYTALRHEPEHRRLVGGGIGAVAVFGDGVDLAGAVNRDESGWSAHVGSVFASPGAILDAPADELDGQFALVRFSTRPEALEVLTDPFGLQPLYIAERDGVTYVSTSVLALARHLRSRPSRLGLEVFLRSGPHFGELTSWEGIERLAPATRLCWDRDGRSRAAIYWRPSVDERGRRMGLDAAARHCVEVSVDALASRYGEVRESWCDITGGFDSRLAALLLHRAGARFITTTSGAEGTPDVVLGERVAARAGWRWHRSHPALAEPDQWRALVDDALVWGDGQMEVVQLAGVLSGHRERAGVARTVFAGGGGEHWRDYAWQQEGPLGGRTRRVAFRRWVDMRFLQPAGVSAFVSDPTPRVRENLVARCRAYAEPYAGELNAVQLDMLYAYKSMAHFGAYQAAARGIVRTELPFYAKPVYAAAFSVAPAHRGFHRLMRRAIPLLDPLIAALPTTTGGPAEPLRATNAARFLPYLDNRISSAARKVTQRLPGPTLGALPDRSPASELDLRRRLLQDLDDRTGLDPAQMRSGPLYDRTHLRALLRTPLAATNGWPMIGRMITAELSLEAADAWLQ